MLVDSRRLEPDSALDADVCVVGGGAAGVTLALRLEAAGLDVVLLESGGFAYDQSVQELYRGEESGTLLDEGSEYLGSTRLRYLGGTTNHWNGWCRPLDAIDFESRDWVPGSGWPLALDKLQPYYRRAARWLEITPFDYAADDWEAEPRPYLFRAGDTYETSYFHVSPPTRFGVTYRSQLEDSERVRVCLHANLVRLETDEGGGRIVGAEAARLDGSRFRVRARAHVLAAGTIENARLLLAAGGEGPGFGNEHDQVGRYFQEHPFVRVGMVALPGHAGRLYVYRQAFRSPGRRPHRVRGVLALSAAAQREHRLLNSLVVLDRLQRWEIPELGPEVAALAEATAGLGREGAPSEPSAPFVGGVTFALEQAPSAASRIRLSDDTDALGMPRTRLEWPLSALDDDSLRRTADLFAAEIARLGGRARIDFDADDPWTGARGSPHQMGSTRMSADPRGGVVGLDSRVHGLDNLYVAGASVFPTSGCSNPTLTLVALTLRLGDHLARRFGR